MRGIVRLAALAGLLCLPAAARGQFIEYDIDPALGSQPTFGPGGYIANGKGYGIVTSRGRGYMPGLYFPGDDTSNGPSSYYSPIWSAMAAAPRPRPPAPPTQTPATSRRGPFRRLFRRD